MACEDCRFVQEQHDSQVFEGYYYRWKIADILIVACEKHTREIFKVLNDYQKPIQIKQPEWIPK